MMLIEDNRYWITVESTLREIKTQSAYEDGSATDPSCTTAKVFITVYIISGTFYTRHIK